MKEEKGRYRSNTIWLVILFIAIIICGIIFLIPFQYPFGFIICLFLVVGMGLYLLVRWHAKTTAYICPNCEHTFAVSTLTDLLSPHTINKKVLRCPSCGESSWCKAVSIEAVKEKIEKVEEIKELKVEPQKLLYFQIGIVILAYAILWIFTLYVYPKLPEIIPTHFNLGFKPDAWGPKLSFLFLPIFAAIFPLTHVLFCFYAAKRGYKSIIYGFITGLYVLILLLLMGIEYLTLVKTG